MNRFLYVNYAVKLNDTQPSPSESDPYEFGQFSTKAAWIARHIKITEVN